MTITVTQEHIKRGKRRDALACPVAEALRDAGFECPVAGMLYIYPRKSGDGINTPEMAKTFMAAFDSNQPVKPFSFDIEVQP